MAKARHPGPSRLFTLDEANGLVADLAILVPKMREALHAYRFAREQIADLEAMWSRPGTVGLEDPTNPDHRDYLRLLEDAGRAEKEAKIMVGSLEALGVEVKDPTLGLVDFPAERAGEVVCLCWQEGETEIVAWHDLTSGFAGRRPIAEF